MQYAVDRDYPALYLEDLLALRDIDALDDDTMVDYVTRAIYWEIRRGDDLYFQCYRKLIWKCVLNDEWKKEKEEYIRSLD
jgi:hypothetical protein